MRDAKRLGLPLPDLREIEQLFVETAAEAFGRGDGIIRVEWSRAKDAPPALLATPRPIGVESSLWRVARSRATHPGPEHRRNTKYVLVDVYEVARKEVEDPGIDEVLLFDDDGFLVEGGRSNFLVVTKDGQLSTPALELGAVEGLGLTLALESVRKIEFARLQYDDLLAAREMMSVNAVRGVVPIVELDGHSLGEARAGSWARRLSASLRIG